MHPNSSLSTYFIKETKIGHFIWYTKWHLNPIRQTRTEIRTEVGNYPNGYWIRRVWISEPEQVISKTEWISKDNQTYSYSYIFSLFLLFYLKYILWCSIHILKSYNIHIITEKWFVTHLKYMSNFYFIH